jgi:nucleoside-diphosphate-sugar epimerase
VRVLVTGASGFIGQHLVNKLEWNGFKVNTLVRSSRNYNVSANTSIFEGDILDADVLGKAVDDVEIVFHLVAKTHDLLNIDNAKDYYKINVEGTRILLNACSHSNIKHFIFISSVKAMAEESGDALDESYVPLPTTPYGESKLMAENLVINYGNSYCFKTTVLRLPLVYGPGNKGNIFKMIEAIDNRRFVMIGRGFNKRSMVNVGNVVDMAMAVIDQEIADKKVYLITDGLDYTVRYLYEIISKRLGKKALPFYVPMGIAKMVAIAGDTVGKVRGKPLPFNFDVLRKLSASLTFSSRRIQKDLGLKPRYNFRNTIDETIKCYRNVRDT